MIAEDYVSYEVAKLLKEKGFDEFCDSIYIILENGDYRYSKINVPCRNSNNYKPTIIVRPTHQMAMKWLREYPRYIFIGIENQYLFSYEVYHFHIRCKAPKREIDKVGKTDYRTYEEAVEAALKYCLTHLI